MFADVSPGGNYVFLIFTVNDFTHTWPGSNPPPLPPFRTRPLSPEEQARFLRDEILEDADWAEVVDQLNAMLHT